MAKWVASLSIDIKVSGLFPKFSHNLRKITGTLFPVVYADSADDGSIADLQSSSKRVERMRDVLSRETNTERLRRMFSYNEYGVISPEFRWLTVISCANFFCGFFAGVIFSASNMKDNFLRQNVATQFESEYLARRQLYDKMILSGMRGGLTRGLKMGFCSTVYVFIAMAVATYNNKVTIFEHIGAGALMGSLYRFNFGPKGMIGAGFLGSILGASSGAALLLYMKLNGTTFEDLRFALYEYYSPETQCKINIIEEIKSVTK